VVQFEVRVQRDLKIITGQEEGLVPSDPTFKFKDSGDKSLFLTCDSSLVSGSSTVVSKGRRAGTSPSS